MAAKWLTGALLSSTVLIAPALADVNDAAHWSGGNCIYNGNIAAGLQSPTYQGVAFGWYQNIGTSGTQTVAESSQGQDVSVEFFRKTNGTMQLHLYVQGTQNGVNGQSQYMNVYSALPLVTTPNTPAYFLVFWDSSGGQVTMDMDGTYSAQDTNSFTVGTPFTTFNDNLPWTVGCRLTPQGQTTQFLVGDLNQLWVDQSNDEYDTLSTPGLPEGAFVLRLINGPPNFLPQPLGYKGTGIFGLTHGAPIVFLQGSGADGLFNRNFWGDFSPLTTNPGTTINFPWHLAD